MENIIDTRYTYVMTYANKILSLEAKLQITKTSTEKEQINSEINNCKSYIDKYTNNSSDYILICAQKIKNAKQKLHEETDYSKREILEYGLESYERTIKSHISNEYENGNASKFRRSQKVDISPISQALEISRMCDEHQAELRSKSLINKEK